MHLSGTTDTILQLQTGLCEIRKSGHHFIFSLSLAQIYQRNCICSARGVKWVKYWFQRLSTLWYYLVSSYPAHWRIGSDIVRALTFLLSLLYAALLGSDYRRIHNCLAPLIKYWDGPHVVCQVSIVVSQGLNTFNNLISTSGSFVHVEREPRRRQYSCGRPVFLYFSNTFLLFFFLQLSLIEIFGLSELLCVNKSSILSTLKANIDISEDCFPPPPEYDHAARLRSHCWGKLTPIKQNNFRWLSLIFSPRNFTVVYEAK